MPAAENWDAFFANWPASLPRRGVLVTTLNDSMPFRNFWIKDGMVLLERVTPDAMGARFVLLDFEALAQMKFTDPLRAEEIAQAGFQEKSAVREPQLAST